MKRSALAVMVVMAIAGAFLVVRRDNEGLKDGPVFAGRGSETGQRLDVGERFSFGSVLLRNDAKTPARLESVRILGMSGGLELLGVQARPVPDETGRGMFLQAFGFPPADWPSKPLSEAHLVPVAKTLTPSGTPGEGLELVIGVRATRPGVARARAVEFSYSVEGRRYREVYDSSMYLCAPKEQFTADTCPGDAHGKFDDVTAEVKIP